MSNPLQIIIVSTGTLIQCIKRMARGCFGTSESIAISFAASPAALSALLFLWLVTDMLDHLATGDRTAAARLRARLHVLVVGSFLARGPANVASYRAHLAYGHRQRTM